jgi:hypothetical protein
VNAKAVALSGNPRYSQPGLRIVFKPVPPRVYQGIQCQYRRCRKMIALKLVKNEKPDRRQSTAMFDPFVVRCPHCMRYQLCESESVQLFEGPPPEPTFRDHPKVSSAGSE